MELTASEIHDMVSQWPEGARAEGLRYADNLVDDEGGLGYWYMPGYGSNLRTNREAADLHALAGLRWLAQVDVVEVQFDHESDWLVCLWTEAKGVAVRESQHPGPTLLHAVSAAVLAVKG